MENNSITVDADRFNQLLRDVAFMKAQLNEIAALKETWNSTNADDEGELTDWAKKELAEARAEPDSELVSSEEAKQMILAQ